MSMSYAPTKLRVPPGFEHLLEGLTREVLRSQPKDIIAFSAEYFRKKIVLRDEEGIDDTKLSVHHEPQDTGSGSGSGGALSTPVAEEVSRSISHENTPSVPHDVEGERRSGLDISDPALNKAATVIQSTFRGHLARERLKDLKDMTEASREPAVAADEGGVMEDGQEEEKKDTGSESGEQEGGKDSVEGDSGEGKSKMVSKEDGVGSMVSVEGGSASEGVEGEAVHGEKEEEGKDEGKVDASEGEAVHSEKEEEGKDEGKVDASEGEVHMEPEPQAAGPPSSSEELIKESESNSGELQQQGKETAGEQTVKTEEQEPSAAEKTGGDDGMSTGAEREGD